MLKKLVIITGKSGSGKTTIVNELNKKYGLEKVKNYTTRAKRAGEDNDYEFLTKKQILDKWLGGELLECVQYNGNIYGIPVPEQEKAICILEPTGASQCIKFCIERGIDVLSIFFYAPDNVLEYRMKKRGDNIEDIKQRLLLDKYMDRYKGMYDHIVNVSYWLEKNIENISKILDGFFSK